jgi:biotin carboxylase
MRETFQKAGIPQPDFYKVSSLDDALRIADTKFKEKSFFLKPPCLGGSSYCSIVANKKQLKTLWQKFFNESLERTKKDPLFKEQFGTNGENYYMLIEELLGGTNFPYDDILGKKFPIFEISVEGFIDNNKTFVYSMTDKLLPKKCQNGEEFMWRMHSKIPAELKEILKQRVTKINQSLGASMGCSHTEFRIEEATKDNADVKFLGKFYRARLIETALRPGGAFMQPAILMSTGYNSIRAMANQACGINIKEEVLYRYPMIIANLWSKKSGTIDRIKNLDKILSLKESIAAFHLYDGVNDSTQIPPEANRGMADIALWGKSINLIEYPNWETKSGNNNLYKEVENLYLQVVEDFKPFIKKGASRVIKK